MRWAPVAFWMLLFCAAGGVSTAAAQVPASGNVAAADLPVQVHLGESAENLYGPWHFKVGDDPAWAQPGLDDRGWETVDLHSADGADPDLGTSGFVPGWTAQGHAGYSGFAWYRLRVNVDGARTALSLKMPDAFDDSYQVFVNGEKIGQFGDFTRRGVTAYSSLPRGFRFPANLRSGTIVIAIRVWMDSATRFYTADAGGLHGPPVLGLAPTIATQVRLDWDEAAHTVGSGFLEMLVLLLALVVALTHFGIQRNDKAYLWLGLVVIVTLLGNLIVLLVSFTTLIPQTPAILLKDVLLTPMRIGLWVLFWASWFGLGTPRRLWHLTCELVLLLAVCTAMLRPPLHGQVVSLHAGRVLTPAVLWLKLGLAGVLIAVTVLGIRRNRAEGWMSLPAVLLTAVANYQSELRIFHIPITFSVLRFDISLGEVSTMLSLLLVTWMGSRRFLLAQRRKVQWELEIQQARELQEVIIPSRLPQVPGLHIESDYRPSREVGGDFFQIIPNRADGSVLVIVGDVTGKGLRAGMLVALIVGAIDAAARENPDPRHVLVSLNERLCERGYATATCLAMRITADGVTAIVNAGHLPPYLNGREVEMDGALPLGTLPGLDYTSSRFQLHDGDALVLMTDGVVEAQDNEGQLFGFDRTAALMAANASVREVADAAEDFGQEDDILVLRVERREQVDLLASVAA
ncbi:MAG TPA: PP2C family protein-serine/threonine phosphatase [Acidobacteriaceae bacterium]|nr:PP2C family protein-serine/threonine phosphatase [Acidobacteriaceae bacterium]